MLRKSNKEGVFLWNILNVVYCSVINLSIIHLTMFTKKTSFPITLGAFAFIVVNDSLQGEEAVRKKKATVVLKTLSQGRIQSGSLEFLFQNS